jgi:flavin-dependent dehydrogenase
MHDQPQRSRYDVIIIGARCAGAATAMLLAREGLRVLAVDQGRYGSDTRSTHALMRGAVMQLHRWGLLSAVRASGTPAIVSTTFHYGDEAVALPIQARDGVDALYAPRRTTFDRVLVDAARASGAEICHRVRLQRLLRDADGRVTGAVVEDASGRHHQLSAQLIVGADGVNSTVARQVGAKEYISGKHATAVAYGYFAGIANEGSHWYFRPGVGAGVLPTNDGWSCVFVAVGPERFRASIAPDVRRGFHAALTEAAPQLDFTRRPLQQRLRSFIGRRGFFRQCSGPGWALVGDAGYFKDPITAHGMTDALRDAELLTEAIVAPGGAKPQREQALAHYQATRDELSLRLFDLSDSIASFNWSLDGLKEQHLALSREMKREVATLQKRHTAPLASAGPAVLPPHLDRNATQLC